MKKLLSAILAAALMLSLSACGNAKTESNKSSEPAPSSVSSTASKLDTVCNVYGLNGPTGIGLAPLMKKAEDKTGRLNYNIATVGSNDEIVAKLTNGEADIAAVATNLASTLYKKTNGGISVLAANTLGVLCLVTKGEEVSEIKDLKGKTVYATGQGANPEYIINFIFEKNGLKVGEDVTINFVAQPTELVAAFAQNENIIAVAPQPVATTLTVKDQNAKISLDMNKEWDKVSDTKLVMGCIVARNEYIQNNPEAVKIFLEEYKDSVDSVNSDTDTAAALCEKYGIVASAAIAKKAIPLCNIVYEDSSELKTDLSAYLKFLFEANPKSVGGALPDDNFYYEAK